MRIAPRFSYPCHDAHLPTGQPASPAKLCHVASGRSSGHGGRQVLHLLRVFEGLL